MHGTVIPAHNSQKGIKRTRAKVYCPYILWLKPVCSITFGIIWNTAINCLDEQNVIAEIRLRFENFKNPETELGRYLLIVKIGRYNA